MLVFLFHFSTLLYFFLVVWKGPGSDHLNGFEGRAARVRRSLMVRRPTRYVDGTHHGSIRVNVSIFGVGRSRAWSCSGPTDHLACHTPFLRDTGFGGAIVSFLLDVLSPTNLNFVPPGAAMQGEDIPFSGERDSRHLTFCERKCCLNNLWPGEHYMCSFSPDDRGKPQASLEICLLRQARHGTLSRRRALP